MFAHIIECAMLNAHILEYHTKPLEHALRGRSKRDFLRFRLQLAEELIGSFQSKQDDGDLLNMNKLKG